MCRQLIILAILCLLLYSLIHVTLAECGSQVIFFDDFESGAEGWSADPLVDGVGWQLINNPQSISVLSPDIDPELVTIPDSGAASLSEAHSGSHVYWFGHVNTGTYIGDSWTQVYQQPKGGGTSGVLRIFGNLTSPGFQPTPKGARLVFWSWWEIESALPNIFDLMVIEAFDGTSWKEIARLNPETPPPWGEPDLHYASGYSGLGEPAVEEDPFKPPQWVKYSIPLPEGTIRVRFRFDSVDDTYNGFRGWIIDDVLIEKVNVGGLLSNIRVNYPRRSNTIILLIALVAGAMATIGHVIERKWRSW